MAASSGFLITEAERRFPVRIRIGVPSAGLGSRFDQIKAWLDENAGANGWAMTPSGTRGVLNDALSIYFGDPTLATAFVARWCAGYQVETAGGVFQVREDEPTPRIGAGLHRTREQREIDSIPLLKEGRVIVAGEIELMVKIIRLVPGFAGSKKTR
jgi:hypothetical protein